MASPWVDWRSPPLLLSAARRAARALRPLLRLARIEPGPFEHILVARVSLELRGKGSGRTSTALALALCSLLGLVPAGLAFVMHDPFLWSLQELALTSGFLAVALFFQLGNLLLDGTDLHVIGPLPVPERTLYAARIAHTLLYTTVLAASMHALPLLAAGFAMGPRAPFALLPAALLAAVFVVAAIALVHALLLRLFGPENHGRATLWAQIVLGACAIGGMQLGNRLIDLEVLFERIDARRELVFAFPPSWFAGLFAALMGDASGAHLVLAAVAVLAPALVLLCALGLARRDLIAGLSLARGGRAAARPWRTTAFQRLGRRIARCRTERAGYDWALTLSRREPAFLRTAYAQIAGYSMMGASFLFMSRGSSELGHAPFVLYAIPLITPTVLELAAFSERPEGAVCLRPLPLEPGGRFYAGALKGLLAGTVLPVYALLLAFASLVSGFARVPEVLLAAALSAWLALVLARRVRVPLPFTRLMRYGSAGNVDFATVVISLLVCLGAAGAHALLRLVPGLALAGAAVAAVLAVRTWRALEDTLVRRGTVLEDAFALLGGPTEDAPAP